MLRINYGFALVSFCAMAPFLQAAEKPALPEGTKFVVQVDLDAFRKTDVGTRALQLVKDAIQEEMGGQESLDKVGEVIGFDPFTDLRRLTIFCSDYDEPEENVTLVLRLGKTSGNLEGLMLTLPGYSFSEHKEYTIHSFSDEKGRRYGAIHTDSDGTKRLVAAASRKDVVDLLGILDGGSEDCGVSPPEGTFAHVRVIELPTAGIDDQQLSNMVKLLQGVRLTLSAESDDFLLDATLMVLDEQRAEQVRQLAQGGVALLSLAASESTDDEDLQRVSALVQGASITRDGSEVRIQISVPIDKVEEVLNLSDGTSP